MAAAPQRGRVMATRALVALGLAVLLVGCATEVRTVTVEVAVPVACEQSMPAEAPRYVDALAPSANVREQNAAMRADIETLEGENVELRAALKACREIGARQVQRPP